MRWRAQAIVRVITALQALLPLSHVVILSPRQTRELFDPNTAALTLRQRLIDTYGKMTADGTRVPMCAYCGTSEGRIEAEHMLPESRGGTDGWNNRVLACATCNAHKGNRTPEEANMPVIVELTSTPGQQNRAGVYARWTARSLAVQLQPHIAVSWPQSTNDRPADVPAEVYALLSSVAASPPPLPIIVAKPIGRPAKQVFGSRNYPLSTPLTTGFVRVKQAIKRRIRVNSGLTITDRTGRRRIQVLPAGEAPNTHNARMVALGMLCEAKRNGEIVIGIVAAIHSTGRLTLLVPNTVRRGNVDWHRIVVSPRQHFRILSTDRVLFMRLPARVDDW